MSEKPSVCMAMEMGFPATDGKPARKRRAVLGPVAHFTMEKESTAAKACGGDEHPFCACCFLTNTIETFKPLIESDNVVAIRFFAARDADGSPQSDCRVNGEDFPAGKEALLKYVKSWPGKGMEFRKQYVVVQSVAAGAEDPEGEVA